MTEIVEATETAATTKFLRCALLALGRVIVEGMMTNDEEKEIRARIPLRLSDSADVCVVLEHLDWLKAEYARVSEQASAKHDLREALAKSDLQVAELKAELKTAHDGHGYRNGLGPCAESSDRTWTGEQADPLSCGWIVPDWTGF